MKKILLDVIGHVKDYVQEIVMVHALIDVLDVVELAQVHVLAHAQDHVVAVVHTIALTQQEWVDKESD